MPTALIADDEIALADYLQAQLAERWPALQVLGQAHNGVDALRLCGELDPDIVFLDIRMPGLSGLDVAARLAGAPQAPHIVFVTAYEQYALDAFEREAIDYLLKPASLDRLDQCIARLQRRLAEPAPAAPGSGLLQQLAGLLQQLPAPASRLDWIRAAHGQETRLISVDEVIYFEARDKYVSVFTAEGEALIRTPLKELIDGLDPARFWQVHRGTIVAVRQIAGTVRDFRGRTLLRLRQRPEQLPVSRAYLHLFRQM